MEASGLLPHARFIFKVCLVALGAVAYVVFVEFLLLRKEFTIHDQFLFEDNAFPVAIDVGVPPIPSTTPAYCNLSAVRMIPSSWEGASAGFGTGDVFYTREFEASNDTLQLLPGCLTPSSWSSASASSPVITELAEVLPVHTSQGAASAFVSTVVTDATHEHLHGETSNVTRVSRFVNNVENANLTLKIPHQIRIRDERGGADKIFDVARFSFQATDAWDKGTAPGSTPEITGTLESWLAAAGLQGGLDTNTTGNVERRLAGVALRLDITCMVPSIYGVWGLGPSAGAVDARCSVTASPGMGHGMDFGEWNHGNLHVMPVPKSNRSCKLKPDLAATKAPTVSPAPTQAPTASGSTYSPTPSPSKAPTSAPTTSGSTYAPTQLPTSVPTKAPSVAPSKTPSKVPTGSPTTVGATYAPSASPSSSSPTLAPTNSSAPSRSPTMSTPDSPDQNNTVSFIVRQRNGITVLVTARVLHLWDGAGSYKLYSWKQVLLRTGMVMLIVVAILRDLAKFVTALWDAYKGIETEEEYESKQFVKADAFLRPSLVRGTTYRLDARQTMAVTGLFDLALLPTNRVNDLKPVTTLKNLIKIVGADLDKSRNYGPDHHLTQKNEHLEDPKDEFDESSTCYTRRCLGRAVLDPGAPLREKAGVRFNKIFAGMVAADKRIHHALRRGDRSKAQAIFDEFEKSTEQSQKVLVSLFVAARRKRRDVGTETAFALAKMAVNHQELMEWTDSTRRKLMYHGVTATVERIQRVLIENRPLATQLDELVGKQAAAGLFDLNPDTEFTCAQFIRLFARQAQQNQAGSSLFGDQTDDEDASTHSGRSQSLALGLAESEKIKAGKTGQSAKEPLERLSYLQSMVMHTLAKDVSTRNVMAAKSGEEHVVTGRGRGMTTNSLHVIHEREAFPEAFPDVEEKDKGEHKTNPEDDVFDLILDPNRLKRFDIDEVDEMLRKSHTAGGSEDRHRSMDDDKADEDTEMLAMYLSHRH